MLLSILSNLVMIPQPVPPIPPTPPQPSLGGGGGGGGRYHEYRDEEADRRKNILEQEDEIILAVIHAAMKVIN